MAEQDTALIDAEMNEIDEFKDGSSPSEKTEEQEQEEAELDSSEELDAEDNDQVETPETEQEQEPDKKSGVQERINKITADKYRLKERAEKAEQKAAELEKKLIDSEKPEDLGEIDPYDPEHISKLVDHRVGQSIRKAEIDRATSEKNRRQEEQNQAYAKRVDAANIPDYGKKMADLFDHLEQEHVEMPWEMVTTIQRDEKGPQIAHYLANNPEKAKSIIKEYGDVGALSFVKLGEIKAGLSGPKKKKTTTAPDPIKTTKGSGGTISKDVANKSMDEIMGDDRF